MNAEIEMKRLHYLRTKSLRDRELGQMTPVGRFREFPLELLWRILACRQ